ncbi:hypothetical protein [Pedobacter sp. NJ-S-72]
MSADLLAKKFDIAVGGISVNTAREKLFNFLCAVTYRS